MDLCSKENEYKHISVEFPISQTKRTMNSVFSAGASNAHVICIPRVSSRITKEYIFGVFCTLKVGFVEKITEIPVRNDESQKCILVRIKWNNSERAKYICSRFDEGKNVKVVYSDPWFWICVSNNRFSTSATYPYANAATKK